MTEIKSLFQTATLYQTYTYLGRRNMCLFWIPPTIDVKAITLEQAPKTKNYDMIKSQKKEAKN